MTTIAQQIKDRTQEINTLRETLANNLIADMQELAERASDLSELYGSTGVGQEARLIELSTNQHANILQGILNRTKN